MTGLHITMEFKRTCYYGGMMGTDPQRKTIFLTEITNKASLGFARKK